MEFCAKGVLRQNCTPCRIEGRSAASRSSTGSVGADADSPPGPVLLETSARQWKTRARHCGRRFDLTPCRRAQQADLRTHQPTSTRTCSRLRQEPTNGALFVGAPRIALSTNRTRHPTPPTTTMTLTIDGRAVTVPRAPVLPACRHRHLQKLCASDNPRGVWVPSPVPGRVEGQRRHPDPVHHPVPPASVVRTDTITVHALQARRHGTLPLDHRRTAPGAPEATARSGARRADWCRGGPLTAAAASLDDTAGHDPTLFHPTPGPASSRNRCVPRCWRVPGTCRSPSVGRGFRLPTSPPAAPNSSAPECVLLRRLCRATPH